MVEEGVRCADQLLQYLSGEDPIIYQTARAIWTTGKLFMHGHLAAIQAISRQGFALSADSEQELQAFQQESERLLEEEGIIRQRLCWFGPEDSRVPQPGTVLTGIRSLAVICLHHLLLGERKLDPSQIDLISTQGVFFRLSYESVLREELPQDLERITTERVRYGLPTFGDFSGLELLLTFPDVVLSNTISPMEDNSRPQFSRGTLIGQGFEASDRIPPPRWISCIGTREVVYLMVRTAFLPLWLRCRAAGFEPQLLGWDGGQLWFRLTVSDSVKAEADAVLLKGPVMARKAGTQLPGVWRFPDHSYAFDAYDESYDGIINEESKIQV